MTQYLNNRDYNETESKENLAEEVTEFPSNPKNSRIVFKLPEKCLYVFYGTWLPMCGGGDSPAPAPDTENAILSESGDVLISENSEIINRE